MTIQKLNDLIERIMPKAKRNLELKGAPLQLFQQGSVAIWVLEDGEIYVGEWTGEEWIELDDSSAAKYLKTLVFEYTLKVNYDSLVRGKKSK